MLKIVLTLLLATAGLGGCGLDDLGVRSVNFSLHPTAMPTPPEGLDGPTVAALLGSSGTINADVHADDLHIEVAGLPTLPTGFSYVAMGSFAEHPRDAIPGESGEEDLGHSHGALQTPGGGKLYSEEHALTTVALGALEPATEAGHWELELTSADLADVEIAAIRAAMIMLVPETGTSVPVLEGEVGEENGANTASEEGAHSHGP